jgi:hypothetical protein
MLAVGPLLLTVCSLCFTDKFAVFGNYVTIVLFEGISLRALAVIYIFHNYSSAL